MLGLHLAWSPGQRRTGAPSPFHYSQYTPSLATLLTFVSPAEVSFQSERPCF